MRLLLLILLGAVSYDAIRFNGATTQWVWAQAMQQAGPLAEKGVGAAREAGVVK